MKRALLLAALLCSLSLTAGAQDFKKGVEAYQRGDYATALREWRPLAEQGHAKAQYRLGEMYLKGEGVIQNHDYALKWSLLAAKQGEAYAAYNEAYAAYNIAKILGGGIDGCTQERLILGSYCFSEVYLYGPGAPIHFVGAYIWSSLAAAGGDRRAAQLRDLYSRNLSPAVLRTAQHAAEGLFEEIRRPARLSPPTPPPLFRELRHQSQSGISSGKDSPSEPPETEPVGLQFARGVMAAVKKDFATALREWRPLAEDGFFLAQVEICDLYAQAFSQKISWDEVVNWCQLTAKRGHPLSMFNMGQMHVQGFGLRQSNVEAYVWYSLAAAGGHEGASKLLKGVAKELTEGQLRYAQSEARSRWDRIQARRK